MPSKKGRKRNKGGKKSGEAEDAPPSSSVSSTKDPSPQSMEFPPPKMPSGFNIDDFFFSKLYKSVNVEGKCVMSVIVRALYCMKAEEEAPDITLEHFLYKVMQLCKRRVNSIVTRLDIHLLEKNFLTADFDISFAIRLLEKGFPEDYRKLDSNCREQIRSLRELRNTLSHQYPLIYRELEPKDEKLNDGLSTENNYLNMLSSEIKNLEGKIYKIETDEEKKKLMDEMEQKKKEKYVVLQIEKLRITLIKILEGVSTIVNEDIVKECKCAMEKRIHDIITAKIQQYDKKTYEQEVAMFKSDLRHKLIYSGREELKSQYKRMKIANPCPWMKWENIEKSSLISFHIDKIYTPLKIEGSKNKISTENLLVEKKNTLKNTPVPSALVVHGLAGCGKTALCLYLLHHWAEGTCKISMLESFNLVILVELRTVRSKTLKEYLKEQRMKRSTADIPFEDLVQRLGDLNLLFIIDGYDEAKDISRELVKDIFAQFPEQRIMVTTRDEFKTELEMMAIKFKVDHLTVEICGFDKCRIEEFTNKVFDVVNCQLQTPAKKPRDFLTYVQKRGRILQRHLKLPLTLALMIYLWIDCPDTLNDVTTCTSLYYQLFYLCQKKLKLRLAHPCSDETLQDLLLFIGSKAWQLLVNDDTVLSHDDVREIERKCESEGVNGQELLSAFLMYECDDNTDEQKHDYSFLHKTQMEYLAAYYLAHKTKGNKSLCDKMGCIPLRFIYNQVIIFLVGHFAREENIKENLKNILDILEETKIEDDNYDFWFNFLAESQNSEGKFNRELSTVITRNNLPQKTWKLDHCTVVSGLELLINTNCRIKELSIDIPNGLDPYDLKEFCDLMENLKDKIKNRFNQKTSIQTELYFWHHIQAKCPQPSNNLLRTLRPWSHLIHFVGSIGEERANSWILDYCYNIKTLRVRVETCGAEVTLANSLEKIQVHTSRIRQLRVTLAVDPESCEPNSLSCLIFPHFKGDLELTLPNMTNENKSWIEQVVKKVSGEYGCTTLHLDKSCLSFAGVLWLMKMLCGVVLKKISVRSTYDLTPEELLNLEKQEKMTQMKAEWGNE